MRTKNILFVCKNNRFRSKIAEAYFNKINKNKDIKASSAGLFEGFPTDKKTAKVVKNLGINMKGKPRAISNRLLTQQELVIIVADNIPKSIFIKACVKKMIKWRIKDTREGNGKEITKITKKITNKVDKLNKKLGKGKW